jgi:hypothetical protein
MWNDVLTNKEKDRGTSKKLKVQRNAGRMWLGGREVVAGLVLQVSVAGRLHFRISSFQKPSGNHSIADFEIGS